jgi:hypothetical protein
MINKNGLAWVLLALSGATALFVGCSKKETFLGTTSYDTRILLKAFSNTPGAYFSVTVDESFWSHIDVVSPGSLQTILAHTYPLPEKGTSHLVVRWMDGTVVIDTTVTLKSTNSYYLLQLDETKPPVFYTSFGEDNTSDPKNGKVKVRVFYKRDTADATPLPSHILLKFYKLVGTSSQYTVTPDESVEVSDGQVSKFIELPDCFVPENGQKVFLGYKIINPATGDTLQEFCPKFSSFGSIEFSSNVGGLFQTASFDYYDSQPGCNFGSPEEIYKMKLLFGAD